MSYPWVKLTKITDLKSPNSNQKGTWEGPLYQKPEPEQVCRVGTYETAPVVKIINHDTFETQDAIYKWESIEDPMTAQRNSQLMLDKYPEGPAWTGD